ncbi:MAG: MmcQ/YjbR family DNA-binding protein [Verrucomicrobiaceae bacterium]|nr:MmcQ/YjbR family DNA-binding protein [Verrucomicrobiaceae bacterium]
MDLPDVIAHCLSLPSAEETTPFGPEALVYKVAGKMFAITIPEDFPARINLKCDPERAVELRDEYKGIRPGWHMNKKHWNTIMLDGSVPPRLVRELVEHSYQLVVAGLPAKERSKLTLSGQKKESRRAKKAP